jgi:hypothetical protein
MTDGDLHDQIASVEADIEQLAQTLDGCRKPMAQVLASDPVILVPPKWPSRY